MVMSGKAGSYKQAGMRPAFFFFFFDKVSACAAPWVPGSPTCQVKAVTAISFGGCPSAGGCTALQEGLTPGIGNRQTQARQPTSLPKQHPQATLPARKGPTPPAAYPRASTASTQLRQ